MSRINHLLTCGLLAASLTGCQSARSVKNCVVNWNPFANDKAQAELVVEQEGQPGEASEAPLADSLGPEAMMASNNPPVATEGPAGEKVEKSIVQVASEEVQGPVATSHLEEEGDSFEAFLRSMENQKKTGNTAPVSQSGSAVEPAAEPESQPAQDSAPEFKNIPVEDPTVTSSATDDLAHQMEGLLADYEAPKSADSQSVEQVKQETIAEALPVDQGNQVEQAVLTQQKNAAQIAFDLASFADASIPEISATSPESAATKSSLADFAEWAIQSESAPVDSTETVAKQEETESPAKRAELVIAEAVPFETEQAEELKTATEMASAQSTEMVEESANPFSMDFPWAAPGTETKPQPAEKKKAQLLVEESAETSTPIVAAVEKTTPQAQPEKLVEKKAETVSPEVLKVVETALGHESWKSGPAGIASVSDRPLTDKQQKIVELLNNKNSQMRMRGIRLAYESEKASSPVVNRIENLLHDQNQSVRAHAASTLYYWNRNTDQAIECLGSVVMSNDGTAAQLAAMYLGDMTRERKQVVVMLQTALLSAQGMTSLHVSEALLKHDPKSVDAVSKLTELMRDESVEVRWLAAHTLGSVQGELQPYAVEALRGGLRDVDAQVRATSALSLGGLGSASQVAVAELTFISAHGDPKVKDAANIALDCIRQ